MEILRSFWVLFGERAHPMDLYESIDGNVPIVYQVHSCHNCKGNPST